MFLDDMSLFALVTALLLEQLHPLSSRQYRSTAARQDRLVAGRVAAAGRRNSAIPIALPGTSGLCLGIQRAGAVSHDGLSPVQPLLHRHPSGIARWPAG